MSMTVQRSILSIWLSQLLIVYPSISVDVLEANNDVEEINAIFMAPLDRGEGTVTMDLWFGSPTAQKKSLIVDTGSSQTAIPCEECLDCGSKQESLYQNSQSRSFHTIQCCDNCLLGYCEDVVYHEGYLRGSFITVEECKMEQDYMEGSRWEASEVSDIVSLRPPISVLGDNTYSYAAIPLNFGCQSSLNGLFLSQKEDGILGMSFSEESYWYQMYSREIIHKKKFSLCIHNHNIDDDEIASRDKAGIITLGGSDKRLHEKPMVFAECFTDDDQWYAVNIERIFLRDNSEGIADIKLDFKEGANHRMYIDSGSTETFLPKCLSKPFKKAFRKIAGMKRYKGEKLTEDEISSLPSIIIELTGAHIVSQEELYIAQTKKSKIASRAKLTQHNRIVIEITPSQYLSTSDDETFQIGINFVDDDEGVLFGTNFMSDFEILFDMESSRIGFAESNCDFESYQSSYSTKE